MNDEENNLGFELKNEFAHVKISLDTSANGQRLMLIDMVTGAARMLDPLLLECLTRMPDETFDKFLPY
jgi:hypothetical protein